MKSNRIRFFAVIVALCLALPGGTAWAEGSPETSQEPVAVSTAPAAGAPAVSSKETASINTALSDLNYKIEVIQGRYLTLGGEIETLRTADREQKRTLSDFIIGSQRDLKKIEKLETESALLRSELTQVREDLAALQTRVSPSAVRAGEKEEDREEGQLQAALRSPWIGVAALGISLIALFVR